jgi:hypothetical protein
MVGVRDVENATEEWEAKLISVTNPVVGFTCVERVNVS